MRNIFLVLILLIISFASAFGQDTTKSVVIKNNRPIHKYPLMKPKHPSYPLMAGYLLVKEAHEGDPFAQHELGLRYLLGQGFPKDTVEAAKWIKLAVDKKLPFANFNYAITLINGIGVPWNPFKAFNDFKFAAESGMAEAEYAVGTFYTDNFVVNRDYNTAYKWIKKAADQGLDYAKKTAKKMRVNGLIVGEDSDSTNSLSNESNSGQSILNQNWELDFFNFQPDTLTEEEQNKSVNDLLNKNKKKLKEILGISDTLKLVNPHDTTASGLIDLASKSGSPEGLYIAGISFRKGISKKKNRIKAAELFIRAYRLGSRNAIGSLIKFSRDSTFFKNLKKEVDNNNPDAMYVWAGLVALGFDYRITYKQAIEFLEKAAEQNHIPSLIELGLAYYSGSIVDKDKIKAVEFWEKAARLGSREAKVRLAYSKIIDGNKNIKPELNFLQAATDEGSVLAETVLGYCYEHGKGVKKNKAIAAKYYRRASERGNETAYKSLKKLYDDIRPSDPEFQILSNN